MSDAPLTVAEAEASGFSKPDALLVVELAVADEHGIFDPQASAKRVRKAAAFYEDQIDQARAFKSQRGVRSYSDFTDRYDEYLEKWDRRIRIAKKLEALPPPPSPPYDEAGHRAHVAWLDRGRTGEGQLYVRGRRVEPNADGLRLDASRFISCDLSGTSLLDAVLDGAELLDCDLRGARLGAAEITFGREGGAKGARFVRCDLRGANLDNLRLDHTIFFSVKLGGAQGKPWLEGPYTMIAPDFSEAGDGSDVRTAEEVTAYWEA